MYVCDCVCMWVCMHVHVRECVYVYVSVRECVYVCECVYLCECLYMRVSVYGWALCIAFIIRILYFLLFGVLSKCRPIFFFSQIFIFLRLSSSFLSLSFFFSSFAPIILRQFLLLVEPDCPYVRLTSISIKATYMCVYVRVQLCLFLFIYQFSLWVRILKGLTISYLKLFENLEQ